jgi:hypothetical protein
LTTNRQHLVVGGETQGNYLARVLKREYAFSLALGYVEDLHRLVLAQRYYEANSTLVSVTQALVQIAPLEVDHC